MPKIKEEASWESKDNVKGQNIRTTSVVP